MTHAPAIDAELEPMARPGIGLPLVSIIVINYNYGRFLADAVSSALAQTYPLTEVLIVDDASTDDSGRVIDRLERNHPEIKVIRCQNNGGQSVATQIGFEASSGDYVILLDADDTLLPEFVQTHVFVHLSLRVPVGFTSSDMAQAAGARLILGTIQHFSDYIRSVKKAPCNLIRRIDESDRMLWPLAVPDLDFAERIHFVPPDYKSTWVWAPTSGNCFRRDALALFLRNEALAELRSCTDAYLLRAISVLTGSVLIDRALSVYRQHGTNVFLKCPNLNGLMAYDRGVAAENDQKGRRMAVDHLIAGALFFAGKMHSPYYYLRALWTLNGSWPRLPSRISGCRSYVGGEVIDHFAQLSEAVSRWQLALLAICLGTAPWTLASALIRSFGWRRKPSPAG